MIRGGSRFALISGITATSEIIEIIEIQEDLVIIGIAVISVTIGVRAKEIVTRETPPRDHHTCELTRKNDFH
jgi:hypothetical protein